MKIIIIMLISAGFASAADFPDFKGDTFQGSVKEIIGEAGPLPLPSKTMEDWQSSDFLAGDGTEINVDYVAEDLGGKITATRVWVSVRNPAFSGSERVKARLSAYYEATSYSAEALQKSLEQELPFNGWNFQARFQAVSIFEAHHSWHHDFIQQLEVEIDGKPLMASDGKTFFRFKMREGADPGRSGTSAAVLKGRLGRVPAELNFDERSGRITGKLYDAPVDITIDRKEGSIKGRVNGQDADIKVYRVAALEGVKGSANGGEVEYTIDWGKGLIEGFGNKTPFLISFEPGELEGPSASVRLSGYANHSVLELTYDKSSGRLTGELNHASADLELSEWELKDFLRYYFLLMKPHAH